MIAAARAGVADLAVVDGADPDLTAEAIQSLRESGMSVIALAPHGDRARLSALGVASVAAPGSPEQVVNSLIAATKTPRVSAAPTCPPAPARPPSPPGSVLAVWGTSGAPGRTTLAAGIATILARTAPTLLVDADTGNPTVAHLLGLPVHASGLSVLARAASRGTITPQDVAAASLERARNLSIITGLATPHRWREVSRSGIAAIVAAARRGARYSVIDVASTSLDKPGRGANRDDASTGVLAAADRIIVVARGDIVGINRLSHVARWWEQQDRDTPVETAPTRLVRVRWPPSRRRSAPSCPSASSTSSRKTPGLREPACGARHWEKTEPVAPPPMRWRRLWGSGCLHCDHARLRSCPPVRAVRPAAPRSRLRAVPARWCDERRRR